MEGPTTCGLLRTGQLSRTDVDIMNLTKKLAMEAKGSLDNKSKPIQRSRKDAGSSAKRSVARWCIVCRIKGHSGPVFSQSCERRWLYHEKLNSLALNSRETQISRITRFPPGSRAMLKNAEYCQQDRPCQSNAGSKSTALVPFTHCRPFVMNQASADPVSRTAWTVCKPTCISAS